MRRISDAFTNAGAKATFFFNGNNYDCIYDSDRVADVKYAYAAGHMIGSHTWSNADLTTLSTPQVKDAMYRVEEALSRILGIKPAFLRPPQGSYNNNVRNIAFGREQNLALWDWDTGDANGNTTAQSKAVYRQIANGQLSNALVLQHETEGQCFHFDKMTYSGSFFREYGLCASSVRYQTLPEQRVQCAFDALFCIVTNRRRSSLHWLRASVLNLTLPSACLKTGP